MPIILHNFPPNFPFFFLHFHSKMLHFLFASFPLFSLLFPAFLAQQNLKELVGECGQNRGCWFVPPNCEQNEGENCTGILSWKADVESIDWEMGAMLGDLSSLERKDTTYYGAWAFSTDEFMGNDTVIACTVDNTGYGGVFVAWNDHTANYLQLQATEVLLASTSSSQIDGQLSCKGRWNFGGFSKVQQPNYLHDLSNSNFHLLFARGYADPRTHQLFPHSPSDGPKFPWISSQTVNFSSPPIWITQSHQSVPSRTAKLGMATIHGILMSLCIFVLFPLGIFSARFGRNIHFEFFGGEIWFQVHRVCMILSFLSMTIAFFGIFWQQNFRILICSTLCQTDDFNKSIHSILGIFIYFLCCFQIILGLCRPSPDSPNRQLFNFAHSSNGLCIFLGSAANAALSTSIGKTGFPSLFAKFPHLLLISIFICLFASFLSLEWIVHGRRFHPKIADQVQRLKNAGADHSHDQRQGQNELEDGGGSPLAVMAFSTLAGLAALGLLWAMLIRAFRTFSTQS